MAANRKPSLFKAAKVGFVFTSAARDDDNRKESLHAAAVTLIHPIFST